MARAISPSAPMDPLLRFILRKPVPPVAVALLGFLFLVTASSASDQKPKFHPVASTFLGKPVEGCVQRGDSVLIPVDVIALPGEKISLQITAPPDSGSLTVVSGDASGKVALLYRSDSVRKVPRVTFTVRIRAGTRAWITATGAVTIMDHPGKLESDVPELDFGEISAGASTGRSLNLRNVSGKTVTGKLDVRSPYQVEGDSSFSLKEGEGREFLIQFKPVLAGDYPSLLASDPFLENFPVVALKARAMDPFRIDGIHESAEEGRPLLNVMITNPESRPVTLKCTSEGELTLPSSLSLGASGSATLSIDTSRAAVPSECTRTYHVTLSLGDYRKTLDIPVKGRDARVVATISPKEKEVITTAGSPVRLNVRLLNESRYPRSAEWQFHGEGGTLEGPGTGTLSLNGGESKELSVLWNPTQAGHYFPSLVLVPDHFANGPLFWDVDCRAPRASPGPGPSPTPKEDKAGGVAGAGGWVPPPRLPMVILNPPVMQGRYYPRSLLLSWSFMGSKKDGFVIEEKSASSGMSDRTGETEQGWQTLHAPPFLAGHDPSGTEVWAVRLPVFYPGCREFRVYPGGEGDRIIANTLIPVSWGMVFGPLLKILTLVALVVLIVMLIRMRANRRSSPGE